MGKKVYGPFFYVVETVDGGKSQHVHYKGNDKGRARVLAQEQLDRGKKEIAVLRVTQATILTPDDLVASLPKDAF